MGLLSFLGCSKPKAKHHEATPPPVSHALSEFATALITLKVNGETALLILLAEDGSVNRMGNGSVTNTDHVLVIGVNSEPLFARFMARVTPEMLRYQGAYEFPNRKGANCELTILLGYRGGDRSGGFGFLYGSESQGPPRDIAELVRYAVELTTPWQEETKRLQSQKMKSP
jgi:hypothetical protein